MNKLTIIISLLIFGFVLNLDEEIYIYDITYLEEFEVPNNKEFNSSYYLYFRMPYPSTSEKLELTTKYLGDYEGKYQLDFCGYTKKPTDEELKENSIYGRCNWIYTEYKLKDKTYSRFMYPLDQYKEVAYVVIKLQVLSEFKNLFILVSPYKKRQKIYYSEIEYNKEVIIDSDTLSGVSLSYTFETKYEKGDEESIIIKLHKDDINDLFINLYGHDIKRGNIINEQKITDTRLFKTPGETKEDGEYKIYNYTYTRLSSKTNYLTIDISSYNNYELKYFSLTLYSTGSNSLGIIIILIVILVLIIIFVILYFYIKKKRNNSSYLIDPK